MQDHRLAKKLEQLDVMNYLLYAHDTFSSSDYREMLKVAENMYRTTLEVLEHIKHEAKKEK